MRLVICLTAVLAVPMQAQVSSTPAILQFPVNVWSAALAGASVAMLGYAGSVFTNPSGLAQIRVLSVEGAFSRLPDRSTYTMGAAAFRVARFNLGAGYQYLRLPAGGAVRDNVSMMGAVVYRWGGISAGTAAKYVAVDDSSGGESAVISSNLSTTVAFFDIAALTVAVENIGRVRVAGDRLTLPRAWHLGASLNLLDTFSNGRLLATIETIWTEGRDRRTVVGLEAGVVVYGLGVVARAGTGGEPGTPIRPFSTTSYGGGLVLGQARIDYAYQRRSVLGRGAHLFGVRWTP